MNFWVERRLEFKTVPARWVPLEFCPTLQEAEDAVQLGMKLIQMDKANGYQTKAKGGGVITEYRVRSAP